MVEPAGAAAGAAPRPGTLVWLLREGGFGRVVATAQGGLLCRVRPEAGGAAAPVLECLGCELLPVAGGGDGGGGEEAGGAEAG